MNFPELVGQAFFTQKMNECNKHIFLRKGYEIRCNFVLIIVSFVGASFDEIFGDEYQGRIPLPQIPRYQAQDNKAF